jgi:L-alanine-DL-glutamate epimerase-like enolase superfamily enzyme
MWLSDARFRPRELTIPFKVAFKHASAERSETSSFWVEIERSGGLTGCGESCPRSYVTGETIRSAHEFLTRHEPSIKNAVDADVQSIAAWANAHRADIDAEPAAWCAVELALLDLLGKERQAPVETILSLAPLGGQFEYTAVLGDATIDSFHAMANQYWQLGFRTFKVKLSPDAAHDRGRLQVFDRWRGEPMRLRADANNLWASASAALRGLEALNVSFEAVEEPLSKGQYGALARIARTRGTRIVLDESATSRQHLTYLDGPAEQWLINVRVSKMGGLMRALDFVSAARDLGIAIIVGAHVGETSLLTRAALPVAKAAGAGLFAQEGAFGTRLLQWDVCVPPLTFGRGGILDTGAYPTLADSGLGPFAIRG